MAQDYWLRQKESLFPDLEWATPEHVSKAGKLLVMGGNAYDFSDVALSYTMVQGEGIGEVKVVMPKSVHKLIPDMPDMNFVANTHAGSFAHDALTDVKDLLAWSEGLFLPGQLGRNSETAKLLHDILGQYNKPTVITKDAINYLYTDTRAVLQNEHLVAVLSLSQLQKMLKSALWTSAVTFGMNMADLVSLLHDLTTQFPITIVTSHHQNIVVAQGGQVSTTANSTDEEELWQLETAAMIAVKVLQHRDSGFFKAASFGVWGAVKA